MNADDKIIDNPVKYGKEQFNKDLDAKDWSEVEDATAFIRYMRGYDDDEQL